MHVLRVVHAELLQVIGLQLYEHGAINASSLERWAIR
jgi:hypothetical protein